MIKQHLYNGYKGAVMEYKYGKQMNYEDYSSGRVLYNDKGATNFPIRLASEIFGRCLQSSHKKKDIILYDCCCGGGYLLTVLGFLYQDSLSQIIGSDIDSNVIEAAGKNLSLLTREGMDKRIGEIDNLIHLYHKPSHLEAEVSAKRLRENLINLNLKTYVFTANALKKIELGSKPDIIMTDVPYGDLVSWQGIEKDPIDILLSNLYEISHENTIVGICMDKKQKITNTKFKRLEKQVIGKRKFEILKKI